MPKKISGNRKSSGMQNTNVINRSGTYEEKEYREIIVEFLKSPAVKYVAGGIAMAMLTRFANRISDRYPEISTFIRDNLENMEGKLAELRSNISNDFPNSRH